MQLNDSGEICEKKLIKTFTGNLGRSKSTDDIVRHCACDTIIKKIKAKEFYLTAFEAFCLNVDSIPPKVFRALKCVFANK